MIRRGRLSRPAASAHDMAAMLFSGVSLAISAAAEWDANPQDTNGSDG